MFLFLALLFRMQVKYFEVKEKNVYGNAKVSWVSRWSYVYHGYMFHIRGTLNLRWFLFLLMFLFVISSFQLKNLIGNYNS